MRQSVIRKSKKFWSINFRVFFSALSSRGQLKLENAERKTRKENRLLTLFYLVLSGDCIFRNFLDFRGFRVFDLAVLGPQGQGDLGLSSLQLPKGKDDFSSVAEVEAFYNIPRAKEKKATGKAAHCEHEAFKDGLYLSAALYYCFKTKGSRLPLWILAITKILYSDSFSATNDVEWVDKHDEKGNFVDIEIRVKELKESDLSYMITVNLDGNRISVQGQKYKEFIENIFPDILQLVNKLGNQHETNEKPVTNERAIGKKFKKSNNGSPQSKDIEESKAHVDPSHIADASSCQDLPALLSGMSKVQASLEKMDIGCLLQSILTNQENLDKRLNSIESKILKAHQALSAPPDHKYPAPSLDASEINKISAAVKEEMNVISSQNAQISMLMQELDSKNNEIITQKKRSQEFMKHESANASLYKENESLRKKIGKLGEVSILIKEKEEASERIEEMSLLQARDRALTIEISGLERLNSTLSEQTKFLANQLETKDATIRELITLCNQAHNGQSPKARPTTNHPPDNSDRITKDSAIIIGDSIIKHVDPSRLLGSNNNEHIIRKETTYTWHEAQDYIKNNIDNMPNVIILHVGTNDIRDGKTVAEIMETANETIHLISRSKKDAKILLTSVAPRGDNVAFNSYPDHPPGTPLGICTENIPGPRAFDSQSFPGPRAFDKPRDIQNAYSIYCIGA